MQEERRREHFLEERYFLNRYFQVLKNLTRRVSQITHSPSAFIYILNYVSSTTSPQLAPAHTCFWRWGGGGVHRNILNPGHLIQRVLNKICN